MSTVLTRASLPAPRAGWETRARCRNLPAGLDFTELTEQAERQAERTGGTYSYRAPDGLTVVRDFAADLERARALCASSSCPVLASCRATALAVTDITGFVGGLTEKQRHGWRKRNKVTVRPVTAADLLPPDVHVRDRAISGTRVNDVTVIAVRDLAGQGMESAEIAAKLGIPVTTVRHCRQILAGSRARRGDR